MYHLLIDTCVWIDLARNHPKILEKLYVLVNQGQVALIIPQIVINEWNKHKQSKVIENRKGSLNGMIKNAKTISEYLLPEKASTFKDILEDLSEQLAGLTFPEIETIESFFNFSSTIRLQVTEKAKLHSVDYALEKKAPFKDKNSMADALILFGVVEYVSNHSLANCVFISSNTADFASKSNKNEIHEDIQELFDANQISFFSNIGLAINEIEEGLIGDEEIAQIDTEHAIHSTLQAIEEFNNTLFGDPASIVMANEILKASWEDLIDSDVIRKIVGFDNEISAAQAAIRASLEIPSASEVMRRAVELDNEISAAQAAIRASLEIPSASEVMRRAAELDNEISAAQAAIRASLEIPSASEVMRRAAELDNEISAARAVLETTTPEESMEQAKFVVYHNFPTKRATIHLATCRYYLNRTADETDNGYWTKPFNYDRELENYILNEESIKFHNCKVCQPE